MRCWQFTPAEPWEVGKYDVAADTALEDVAGNQIGRPFEVDVFRKSSERSKPRLCDFVHRSGWPAIAPGNTLSRHPAQRGHLLCDDQAWTDYGFMGHPQIKTPHLDKLATESAGFTRGYVPTSLCRPSLMTLITGLYPHQHWMTGNDPPKGTDRRKC